tara:strand:- start:446 stop:1036 length:591 start_codon:yes stop_codon:yes gene_type:complete
MRSLAVFLITLLMPFQLAYGLDLSPEQFLEFGGEIQKTEREYLSKWMFTLGSTLMVSSSFVSSEFKPVIYGASGIYFLLGGVSVFSKGLIEQKYEEGIQNPNRNKRELLQEVYDDLKMSRYMVTAGMLAPILLNNRDKDMKIYIGATSVGFALALYCFETPLEGYIQDILKQETTKVEVNIEPTFDGLRAGLVFHH